MVDKNNKKQKDRYDAAQSRKKQGFNRRKKFN